MERFGFVGLPNAGKSSLYNALAGGGALAAPYAFATVDPNVGVAKVPDRRVDLLGEMAKTRTLVHAAVQFVDIAGLVKGAAQGEGLGNRFLAHIREVDAVVFVLRAFSDPDVPGSDDPLDQLSTLEVEGRKETPKDDIMLALGAMKGDPILEIDLEAARQRIVDLPWVTSAVVERRLPGTLRVTLTEAEPLALWQKKGDFYLVSDSGDVLAVKDVARFGKLPVIIGDAAPQKAGDLFAMLGLEPELEKRVTAAVLVGNRRWNLRLDNGVDIKLPEVAAGAAWQKFASLEKQHHLLDKDISIIDLRQDDKLVVRQAHPAVAEEGEGDATKKSTKIKPEEKPVLTPVSAPGAKNDAT